MEEIETAISQFNAGRYENISVAMFCKLTEYSIDISEYIDTVRPSDYFDTLGLLDRIAIQQWRIALTWHRQKRYYHSVWLDFCDFNPSDFIKTVDTYRCVKFRCNPGLKAKLYIRLLKKYSGPFFSPECRIDDDEMRAILAIRPDFFHPILKNGLSAKYYLELCNQYQSIGTGGIPYKFNTEIPTELQLLIMKYSPELYLRSDTLLNYSPTVTLQYLRTIPSNIDKVINFPLQVYDPLRDRESCIRMIGNKNLQRKFFRHPHTRVSIPDLIKEFAYMISLENISNYADALDDETFLDIVERCQYIPGRCEKYARRIPYELTSRLVDHNSIKKITNPNLIKFILDVNPWMADYLTVPQLALIS